MPICVGSCDVRHWWSQRFDLSLCPVAGLKGRLIEGSLVVAMMTAACGGDAATVTTTDVLPAGSAPSILAGLPWVEEAVTFSFGDDELYGVLTVPADEGPHPAVVLISGSGGPTGDRAGASTGSFIDHSHRFAVEGFAVLRYDPPGVGGSTGESGFPSLEMRTQEAAAALSYLRSLPAVAPERVGLLGVSQGPWVIAMTAVRYPQDVAFLISVVGSGQSVAQQQIYGIEAQSRAAGMPEEDVTAAVLFGRLLIDWQLIDPIFREANEADARALGDGPWTSLMDLVYEPDDIDPVEGLAVGIEIMKSVQEEPWTEALYLKQLYIPRFESIPADVTLEQLAALQAITDQNLTMDPKEFLTEVRSPVLAFFGEDDLNVDSRTSPALYERYLTEAGNQDFTLVVIPGVGHGIGVSTPGYWDTLSEWLAQRFIE